MKLLSLRSIAGLVETYYVITIGNIGFYFPKYTNFKEIFIKNEYAV